VISPSDSFQASKAGSKTVISSLRSAYHSIPQAPQLSTGAECRLLASRHVIEQAKRNFIQPFIQPDHLVVRREALRQTFLTFASRNRQKNNLGRMDGGTLAGLCGDGERIAKEKVLHGILELVFQQAHE